MKSQQKEGNKKYQIRDKLNRQSKNNRENQWNQNLKVKRKYNEPVPRLAKGKKKRLK